MKRTKLVSNIFKRKLSVGVALVVVLQMAFTSVAKPKESVVDLQCEYYAMEIINDEIKIKLGSGSWKINTSYKSKDYNSIAFNFESNSPSLLFTKSQLEELKMAVKSNTGTLRSSYDNLIVKSNAGLSYQTEPYTGTDSQEFYMRLKDPSGLARNLALAYALTNDKKYARKSIEIMKEWAIKCQDINYVKYAGTSMIS